MSSKRYAEEFKMEAVKQITRYVTQRPGNVLTQESWLYLCVVVDLYSGVVVG